MCLSSHSLPLHACTTLHIMPLMEGGIWTVPQNFCTYTGGKKKGRAARISPSTTSIRLLPHRARRARFNAGGLPELRGCWRAGSRPHYRWRDLACLPPGTIRHAPLVQHCAPQTGAGKAPPRAPQRRTAALPTLRVAALPGLFTLFRPLPALSITVVPRSLKDRALDFMQTSRHWTAPAPPAPFRLHYYHCTRVALRTSSFLAGPSWLLGHEGRRTTTFGVHSLSNCMCQDGTPLSLSGRKGKEDTGFRRQFTTIERAVYHHRLSSRRRCAMALRRTPAAPCWARGMYGSVERRAPRSIVPPAAFVHCAHFYRSLCHCTRTRRHAGRLPGFQPIYPYHPACTASLFPSAPPYGSHRYYRWQAPTAFTRARLA